MFERYIPKAHMHTCDTYNTMKVNLSVLRTWGVQNARNGVIFFHTILVPLKESDTCES